MQRGQIEVKLSAWLDLISAAPRTSAKMSKGIALDLGSSGFRALAIDLSSGNISSGACTTWHPLPGGNVIDHILFSITYGQGLSHEIVIRTAKKLIELVSEPGEVELIAVCGNPIQLALFTNGELRDLAFSQDSLKRKGIAMPSRDAQILDASELGLGAKCDVLVPPSVKGEVGADCIAMIKKSGMLQESTALAIDFGTNAEMALKADGRIYVGSAAAGPAIEGQHIGHGMLASPGAICDLEYDWGWKCKVLDEGMEPKDGDTVDMGGREIKRRDVRALGITGTGIIALVSIGFKAGYIDPPHIITDSRKLLLQDGIDFGEADLLEAGKAFGAIKAGWRTLAEISGMEVEDVGRCFMAGAAGSFADPYKARDVGLIPASTKIVYQLGNTSLEMAADLVSGRETIDGMQSIADLAEHISFSESEIFKQNYLAEYSRWCEGAPGPGEESGPAMSISRIRERVTEKPMQYFRPTYYITGSSSHQIYAQACPRKALFQKDGQFVLDLRRCLGASCLRCEHICPGFKLGARQN